MCNRISANIFKNETRKLGCGLLISQSKTLLKSFTALWDKYVHVQPEAKGLWKVHMLSVPPARVLDGFREHPEHPLLLRALRASSTAQEEGSAATRTEDLLGTPVSRLHI